MKKGQKMPEHLRQNMRIKMKGKQSPMKGKKRPDIVGNKNPQWKDKCNYRTMHKWVEKWKGCPKLCEKCGTTTAKRFEWANVDHLYQRQLDDYIRMCTPCHRVYDIQRNNYPKNAIKTHLRLMENEGKNIY